jgi:peptide/nickel transport system permease protein
MSAYIIRRVLQIILIMFLVTLIVFIMIRILPGDPVLIYLSRQDMAHVTQERIDYIKQLHGLDKPLVVQYFNWMGQVVRGDLGISIIHHGKIIDDIKRRLPISFELGILSFIIYIFFGTVIGVIAAVRRGTWLDNFLTAFGNLGICVPSFWLGILLIYILGYKLDWLPIYGFTSPFTDLTMNIRQIIMPVFCLAIAPIAGGIRLTRSSMLEVMGQDYIRTAWSKGLKERAVIFKHALRNGLMPVVTVLGMSIAAIVGGSVLIETVFSIPGMGRLAVEALFSQDYSVVQAILLIDGFVVLGANLLTDIAYVWVDPRIRYT